MNAPLPSASPPLPLLRPGDGIRLATLAGVVALPLVLAGCGGGGGGGGGSVSSGLVITELAIEVTVDNAGAAVTVSGAATDGSKTARFALNGGSGLTTRARDPGSKAATAIYDFAVVAVDTNTASRDCYVAMNPALERSLPAANAAVLQYKHLFNRLGFGASEEEMLRFRHMSYNAAITQILAEATIAETTQGPPSAASFRVVPWQEFSALSASAQDAHTDKKSDLLTKLNTWWWHEMINTKHPILERMALFWHNLLVVNAGDISEPKTMWTYLDLLRTNALGSFRDLLHGIAKDPAMALFLDSNSNKKGKPNENFGRELLELFTLGEGQGYNDADVVKVARCFTGWHVTNNHEFIFRQNHHDVDSKDEIFESPHTFTVNNPESTDQVRLDGEAVLDHLLGMSRLAIFICEKLWDEFIGGTRNGTVINSWANTFRTTVVDGKNYQIKPLLTAILTHSAFTNTGNYGNMLRSPVELHVSLFRSVGVQPKKLADHDWQANLEDQYLLRPPNVRGWIGGLSWIDAKSLLQRRSHMQSLGWEFFNSVNNVSHQKIPVRLMSSLETLWFATPIYDQAAVNAGAASQTWDPFAKIRFLLLDPALHCK